MSSAGRVLFVDDDATLRSFLKEYLEKAGFEVETAAGGPEALRLYFQKRPDLVVLDIMMPGMDGWEVCARMRELSDTPVILLTAKASEADKLRGFRLGVDDFVTKPFSMAELAARMRAILSRTAGQRSDEQSVHQVGELLVDMRKREARLGEVTLDLSPTEFRLLAVLARRAGEAVSQEDLIAEVWGPQREKGGSALRRYIWFLRQKIEADADRPERLVTVRGYGYRLEG